MTTNTRRAASSHHTPVYLTLALAMLAITATAATSSGTDAAKEILSATGVRGGLLVHLGCGDGHLTAALRANESTLVQGLDADPANVRRAREHVHAAGLYGSVSIDLWRPPALPYTDNLVNLLVIEDPKSVPEDEVLRVLAPGGVAAIRQGGAWRRITKPIPPAIDDWSHALYDATNNAVAHDQIVGPPHHLQWVAGPRNARHHEHLASTSVVVSAGGRLFYIMDEAPLASILLRPRWMLFARDAYSGVLLWKRPIAKWESHMRSFRSGPAALPRRLVATADTVYVTLGSRAPVTALDAATGESLRTFDATRGAEEILHADGVLFLVMREAPDADDWERTILAVDPATGDTLWKRMGFRPMPTTLAISGGRVFFVDQKALVCLDARTGEDIWRSPREVPLERPGWSAPTLVAHGDVVLCADRKDGAAPGVNPKTGKPYAKWLVTEGVAGELTALSAKTGDKLWSCPCAETYHAAVDVFVVDGLVWVGRTSSRTGPDLTEGRDLHTGEIKRRIATDEAFDTTMPHHRCHRNRATDRYIVTGRTGVEFIDVRTGECSRHHWVRGVCQYGFLPCNGLLYTPPHSCACYIEAKLTGFCALAPGADGHAAREPAVGGPDDPVRQPSSETRWEASPNRDAVAVALPPSPERRGAGGEAAVAALDWPTYRHDAARTGATESPIPTDLQPLWEANIGGRVTSPVIADGKVFVASVDTHTLHVLDARDGSPAWRFTAGGRIDSPPTIRKGLVVFGSADGCVYCLRASDGQRVWRFRAAPKNRRLVAFGQVESAWPVHGAVLVQNDVVYCAAGRSSYLDGGIHLLRLDLLTGRPLAERRLYSRDPQTGRQPDEPMMFEMPGALPDVLSADEDLIYMRHLAFDPLTLEDREAPRHLYSPAGFLNDDWWHRTYWIYGTHFYCGYIGWYFAGREAPAGRLLALSDSAVYGFAYKPEFFRGCTGRKYHFFAADKLNQTSQDPPDYKRANRDYPPGGERKFKVQFQWTADAPMLARAMVLADEALFVAGPSDKALRLASVLEGKRGGVLRALSTLDGKTRSEYHLDALPVLDGMAAARGRLFIATQDGRILCAGEGDAIGAPAFLQKPSARERPGAGAPVEPGLAGHWKLDEGRGDTAADSSGLGNDGEAYGQWVKGEFGVCLLSDGIPGALTIADGPHLHFGASDFSIALWLKPDRFDTRILGKENFPENWWVINLLQDGRAELVLGESRAPGKTVRPTSDTPLSADAWTHLAFVIDRSSAEVTCYVNGAPDGKTPIPPTLTGGLSVEGADLQIPSAHKPFVGLFDEIKLYRRALTAAQVAAAHESEKPRRLSASFTHIRQ